MPHMLHEIDGRTARELVDELGEEITELLTHAQSIALETCTTQTIRQNTGPAPHYYPGAVRTERKRVKKEISKLSKQLRALEKQPPQDGDSSETRQQLKASLEEQRQKLSAIDKQHARDATC